MECGHINEPNNMSQRKTPKEGKKTPGTNMTSAANYRIKIAGLLDKAWSDWFNGTEIERRSTPRFEHQTTLYCHVRDQAELLGILIRLNSLNFPLIQVVLEEE